MARRGGFFNLTRNDNVELVLDMDPALDGEAYTVHCFSRSWNVIRYKEGVGGAAYQ